MTAMPDPMESLRHRFALRLREELAALLALREGGAGADEGSGADLIARAHKLAGIAGMLGAVQVGEAALRLEEALLAGQDPAPALAALEAAIGQAIG